MPQLGFQFVTVHASKSTKNSKIWLDTKERRKVRVQVMRDYVRQKKDPHYKFSPASLSMDMKSHIARFRPVSRKQKVSSHSNLDSIERAHHKGTRLLKPHGEDVEHEAHFVRILGLGGVDPFSIVHVDLSNPETSTLCEYYFKSYWSNSLAVNPNGGWNLIALRDEAIIHAKLSLVAVHKADRTGELLPHAYLKHRGLALRLIAKRLAEKEGFLSDECIGAVAILSSSDYHSQWPDTVLDSHARGLAALIEARGGIDAPTMQKNVARVVAWTDMLQAALRERHVMAGRSRHAKDVDISELNNLTGKFYTTTVEQRRAVQHFPSSVRNVIRQLRMLSDIRTTMSTKRIPRLSEMFSDMLWKTEYDILELDQQAWDVKPHVSNNDALFDCPSAFAVLRDAFLTYSYMAFRDQNSVSVYQRLATRLEEYFCGLVGSQQNLSALPVRDLVLLLWVLYTGWKGATLAHRTNRWFSYQATYICHVLVLGDEDKVTRRVKSLAWNEENDPRLFPQFWDEVKTQTIDPRLQIEGQRSFGHQRSKTTKGQAVL